MLHLVSSCLLLLSSLLLSLLLAARSRARRVDDGPLPMARVRALFDGATSMRVAPGAHAAVAAALKQHVEQLADDLVDQLSRSRRSTVEEHDLMSLFAG